MVNVEFLVVAYFVTMFIDWIFQWQFQAINKSKWSKGDNYLVSLIALSSHSLEYSFISTSIINRLVYIYSPEILFIVLFISHFIIDSRIPVKWIMRFKDITKEQINDYTNFGFMHIGIDHRLHEMVLLILSLYL